MHCVCRALHACYALYLLIFRRSISLPRSARAGRGGTNSHNSSFSHNNGHTNGNSNSSYYQDDETEGGSGGGSIDAYLERQLTWVEKRYECSVYL